MINWITSSRFTKPGLRLIPRPVKLLVKQLLIRDPLRISSNDKRRLQRSPRYMSTRATVLGKSIRLNDPYWYLITYHEIFNEQVYKFNTDNGSPYIIDCGSNIGLSVIYFKYLYPEARIVAFEPDPEIFQLLEFNVNAFNFQGIELHRKAISDFEGEMTFWQEGSVGGRLHTDPRDGKLIDVQVISLRSFLKDPVTLLKIDIEGAELKVLENCSDLLVHVEYLFVEYHGRKGEPQLLQNVLEILKMAGFRYHIREINPVIHPFIASERERFYDLQLNIYGFRE